MTQVFLTQFIFATRAPNVSAVLQEIGQPLTPRTSINTTFLLPPSSRRCCPEMLASLLVVLGKGRGRSLGTAGPCRPHSQPPLSCHQPNSRNALCNEHRRGGQHFTCISRGSEATCSRGTSSCCEWYGYRHLRSEVPHAEFWAASAFSVTLRDRRLQIYDSWS